MDVKKDNEKIDKAEKFSNGHKRDKIKTRGQYIWYIISSVLFILLIVSIFTRGFTINNSSFDAVVSMINDLESKIDDKSTLSRLDSIKEDIITLKKEYDNKITTMMCGVDEDCEPNHTNNISEDKKIDVVFYVMSQCPYGTMVEDSFKPVMDNLSDYINFRLEFIARENEDGSISSLHGPREVNGDIVQLCVQSYYKNKVLDFVVCMNKDVRSIPNNWEDCADSLSLDKDTIKECYEGDEGKELLKESAMKSIKARAVGSPTMYFDGELYQGGRSTLDFMRKVCNLLEEKGVNTEVCSNVPKPADVNLIIISDERCDDCDTKAEQVIASLKSIFPGLKTTQYDYNNEKGKEKYEEFKDMAGELLLPAFIFDESIKEEIESYSKLQNYLVEIGDRYYNLKIGSKFDPEKEICDNGIDDNGDNKVDCEDEDCVNSAFCKYDFDNNNPTIQFFIMSYCPYGLQFLKAILPIWKAFEDAEAPATIELRFVSYTMHGEKEETENKRMVCIREEQEDKLIDYLSCFVKEDDSESCLEEVGIDTEALETCMDQNFEDYFEEDKQLNQDYGVKGSPTFVINGKITQVNRVPESIKESICNLYDEDKKPEICNEQFSTDTATPGFGIETNSGSSGSAGSCG